MCPVSVGSWIHGGEVGETDLETLRRKLYFDLEPGTRAYVRFGILLVLSVIIATGGVVTDSTATVIGAMIVAPLMTPIVATALAVVTGDADRMARSFAIVVAGAAVSIGLSAAMVALGPVLVDVDSNVQIVGRTSPRLLDLVVALASGAAGAFALSREDVSDALPGVAIAISLVPPLCVVGTGVAVGSVATTVGALLLFLTNLVAILVAGGSILAVMGYGAVALESANQRSKRRAVVLIALGTIAVVIPLALTSIRIATDTLLQRRTADATDDWLEGTGYRTLEVTVDGGAVDVTISGSGDPPPVGGLVDALEPDVPGDLDVYAVEGEVELTGSPPGG